MKGNKDTSIKMAKNIIKENNIKSNREIQGYLWGHFKFSNKFSGIIGDQQDLNYTIENNWRGDHDDYAIASYRFLNQLNYNPQLLTIISKKDESNHVICIGKDKDETYFAIGTQGLHSSFKTKKDLVKYYCDIILNYDDYIYILNKIN
jgi:hypothetical protein